MIDILLLKVYYIGFLYRSDIIND